MKLRFVSIQNAISDFIEDNDIQEEVSEGMLLKWATDASKDLIASEQFLHKVTILYITNYSATLPDDFNFLQQAASRVRKKNNSPTRKEQVVEWTQNTYNDCDIKISLDCPDCYEEGCTPPVEVEVDRIWELANPQQYYKNVGYRRVGEFGKGNGDNFVDTEFKLMRWGNESFFAAQYCLTDCPNINCSTCTDAFIIEDGVMKTDFKEGEVLVSYLGTKTDEDGNIMIPDHPDVHRTVLSYLEYKWWGRKHKTLMLDPEVNANVLRSLSQEAKMEWERSMGIARNAIQIPEQRAFNSWLSRNWNARPSHPIL